MGSQVGINVLDGKQPDGDQMIRSLVNKEERKLFPRNQARALVAFAGRQVFG